MPTLADVLPPWAWPAVVALLVPVSCMAQSISGVVYDPDGGVVPNARVMLMQDYVKQKEMRSSKTGKFAFSDLQPGTYQLQVKQERLSLFQQTVMLGGESERVYAVLPFAVNPNQCRSMPVPLPVCASQRGL